MKHTTTTTKHTCGGPAFGRLAQPGTCKRCDELRSGAPRVKGWGQRRREQDARRAAQIRAHDCKARNCGPVCTAFDW